MGIIRILFLINIELAGDKLNGGDEGSEKDGSKNRTLRNTCFELGCGGDMRVQPFVDQGGHLKCHSPSNRQPVQIHQYRCDVVVFMSFQT